MANVVPALSVNKRVCKWVMGSGEGVGGSRGVRVIDELRSLMVKTWKPAGPRTSSILVLVMNR